ncbi:DMT family transporter [Mesorhizobium sp. CAU 1741]|uniref:DMT family transporter n=1 Tax=Mesorhizobium sp. CAU 1741 TaxID=3140366 RepID=UPI00325AC773
MKLAPASRVYSPRDVIVSVGLMLVACALVAATTLIAKMLGPAAGANPLHPLQVSAGRFLFAFLVLLPLLAWKRPDFKGARWGNHILRVLFGWAGVSCLFAASSAMRLADATAISFLNPIVAMMLSIPLLGERVGPWRWGAAAIAFAGAVILSEPGTEAFQPIALVALAAAVFMGAEAILIKKLTDSEPPLRILAINNFIGAVLALSAASFVWRAPLPGQWLLLAAVGATMVTVQALFIQAMKRGDASFVVPFFYTTLIYAGVYDYLVFSEQPTTAGLIGALLIIGGALTIAWRERVQRRSTPITRRAAG